MARTEDDLRAAFLLAAQDALPSEEVLAKLRSAEAADRFAATRIKPARVRQWLPAIAIAAVVIAIAVPVGFAISNDGGRSRSSASDAVAGAPEKAAGAASSAASGAASGNFVGPSATGGPLNTAPLTPSGSTSSGPVCQPDDLSLTLAWTTTASGLRGTLTARNISGLACDLAVKPAVYPLDANRTRLDVRNVTTAEGYAGPSSLLAGASASSSITWSSWCGAKADAGAQVDWGFGPATISVSGPTTPSCVGGQSGAISSTWFSPLS